MTLKGDEAFEALLDYIKHSRGFDFTGYKRTSLRRRVDKRMRTVDIQTFDDYVDYLEVHPEEFTQLFNTILINVTAFFRDAPAWDYLAQAVIPQILAGKDSYEPIRVWSAGCASGEEVYTIAILLAEALGPGPYRQQVKIYATDVDEEALAQARHASYSAKNLQAVPTELRDNYFEQVGERFVFRSDLRRAVIFGRHDLVQDAPISRLDLLVCRNTLMYFNAETQGRIVARLHFALNDSGLLFLGKAEMLMTHTNLFSPANLRHRLFARVARVNLRDRLLTMSQAGNEEINQRLDRRMRLQELSLDAAPVAQVVVDANQNLALANERARSLFGLDQRDMGRPFKDLELSYRPAELRSLMEQVYAERRAMTLSNVRRPLADGGEQYLDVRITPLQDQGRRLRGMSISFTDVTRYQVLQEELEHSTHELETTNEELQSTNEELETTNEELQSTVEELETTNEELQSTNEELETMNEELQSTNEELQTLNDELQQRTDELNRTNAFLNSILASMRAGVIVLDCNFHILTWNPVAEELWGLRADEARGQPFLNLDIGLPVEKLKAPLRACLAGDPDCRDVRLEAVNRRGRTIECLISCNLLVNAADEPQGVIVLIEKARSEA
jgi:two-component system CheB/CheR fusion protein